MRFWNRVSDLNGGRHIRKNSETYPKSNFGWYGPPIVDVDTDKASDGKVGGVISLSRTEIVFEIGFLGYRRVYAASEENGVK